MSFEDIYIDQVYEREGEWDFILTKCTNCDKEVKQGRMRTDVKNGRQYFYHANFKFDPLFVCQDCYELCYCKRPKRGENSCYCAFCKQGVCKQHFWNEDANMCEECCICISDLIKREKEYKARLAKENNLQVVKKKKKRRVKKRVE